MSACDSGVDAFLLAQAAWRDVFTALRDIALGCGLAETIKWGKPCYTDGGANIALLQGFKDYRAVLFFKGALLRDPDGLLVAQSGNMQSARQIRVRSRREVDALTPMLRAYLLEAVAVERSGVKVAMKRTADFPVADELSAALQADSALRAAFEALTPGRQRAYLLHFAAPKQSAPRAARIARCTPRILAGKGLLER